MREFPHPNMTNFECPICKSTADAPVVLVPIPGTEEGRTVQAKQVHAECYRLVMRMNGFDSDVEEGE